MFTAAQGKHAALHEIRDAWNRTFHFAVSILTIYDFPNDVSNKWGPQALEDRVKGKWIACRVDKPLSYHYSGIPSPVRGVISRGGAERSGKRGLLHYRTNVDLGACL